MRLSPSITLFTLAITVVITFSQPLNAELWIVPDEIDNIQTALDASQAGDTVLVMDGLYEETLNFNGRDVLLTSQFFIDGDREHIANTIIDPGDQYGSIVNFTNGESADARLIGFTLTGGSASEGGGVVISGSSPTLSDLVITGCEAVLSVAGTGMGGGIFASGSPTIDRVEIRDCRATYGAGIVLRDGQGTVSHLTITGCEGMGVDRSPARCGGAMMMNGTYTIEHSVISDNISHGGGAGVYTANGTFSLNNCLVQNNRAVDASGLGGGLSFQGRSVVKMERCLVTGNSATTNGGGITMYLASLDIVNSTIYGNSAGADGGAIYQFTDCAVVAVNSIIAWNGDQGAITFRGGTSNSFTSAFSCIPGGTDGIVTNGVGDVNWLDGNIEDDPLLAMANEGDFHLIPESPCIDAGTDFYEYRDRLLVSLAEDEYNGDMPDMGVYEYQPESVRERIVPLEKGIIEAWPNPFNSSTAIAWGGDLSSPSRLVICDLQGRIVANLWQGGYSDNLLPEVGNRNVTVIWDAQRFAAGTYFGKLESAGVLRVIRLELVR